MITQSKGKIFLADERGFSQTKYLASCNTFNFGNYFNQHKDSFGNIHALNDDTLCGGGSVQISVEEACLLILLPVSGAINYSDSFVNETLIVAGQAQILAANKNITIEISNPF